MNGERPTSLSRSRKATKKKDTSLPAAVSQAETTREIMITVQSNGRKRYAIALSQRSCNKNNKNNNNKLPLL
jgi:hypothetical protein